MCTWNIEKRIFFIILKFIIRSSNMDVHTCRCIWFIAMSGWIQNSKWIQIAFENKFEKGSEIKEKKRKGELENKRVFKSLQKFSFGDLPKVLILKSIFETIFEFDWNLYLKMKKKEILLPPHSFSWASFAPSRSACPAPSH